MLLITTAAPYSLYGGRIPYGDADVLDVDGGIRITRVRRQEDQSGIPFSITLEFNKKQHQRKRQWLQLLRHAIQLVQRAQRLLGARKKKMALLPACGSVGTQEPVASGGNAAGAQHLTAARASVRVLSDAKSPIASGASALFPLVARPRAYSL